MRVVPNSEGASIMAPGSALVLDPSSSDSYRRSYVWLPIIMSTSKDDYSPRRLMIKTRDGVTKRILCIIRNFA